MGARRSIVSARAGPLQALALALAGCGGAPVEPRDPARADVLVIVIDTLSARHLGAYGYPRPTSPNLDALGAAGLRFTDAGANAPWTQPSLMALTTGVHAASHVQPTQESHTGEMLRIHPDRVTLAELFRGGGFATAGFVDIRWLDPAYGFAAGFDVYDTSAAERALEDREGGIRQVSRRYLEWLDGMAGEDGQEEGAPTFGFLHAFDVHGPYLAPAPFVERVSAVDAGLDLPASLPASGLAAAFHSVSAYVTGTFPFPAGPPEAVDPAPYLDAYDAGIAEVDAALGDLFDELRERRRFDNTWIVVTADHGESIELNGRYFGHGTVLQDILHVPLIVKPPANAATSLGLLPPGSAISTPVQHVDLWPTLADVCGLEPPEGVHQDGRSLRPLMSGAAQDPVPQFASEGVFTQASVRLGKWRLSRYLMRGGDPAPRMTFRGLDDPWLVEHLPEIAGRSLTAARLRAIQDRLGGLEQLEALLATREPASELRLHDLSTDPRERVNLADEFPEVAAELNRRLTELYRAALEQRLDDPTAAPPELTDEALEALRAVGYLEDAADD